LADAAYAANDPAWAGELFERLRAADDSNENQLKGLAGLGWTHLKAGKPLQAAAAFQELLEKNPPPAMAAEAALACGQALEQLDRAEPALAMYGRVIDKHAQSPQHRHALLAAARLRARLEQPADADALYKQLVEKYTDDEQLEAALYEWAWVLHDLDRQAEVVALFERLRQQHAESRYGADAAFRLAQRAFAEGEYDQTEQLVTEVLAGKADDSVRESALYLRAQVAVAQRDWAAVDAAFAALLSAFPQTSAKLVAEFWMAESAYRREDYAAAGKRFDRLAGKIAGRSDAYLATVPLRRAQLLAQREKWDEAYAIASQIEAAYPDFPQQYEVDYLLGHCLQERAEFDAAREVLGKAIRSPHGAKTETAAMAQWRIAETYFQQKDYEAAVREYLRLDILYAYPTLQAAALVQAGKCHEKLNQPAEAAALYNRVLEVYGDSPSAERAQRRLGSLEKEQPANDGPATSLARELAPVDLSQ
jgi:TolA-binding protein